MKPFTFQDDRGEEVTLHCRHKDAFPPIQALLEESAESLHARGVITGHKLMQVNTWRKVCGLTEMGDKCKGCPAAMVEGILRGKKTLVPYCPPPRTGVGAPPQYRIAIKKGGNKKDVRTHK